MPRPRLSEQEKAASKLAKLLKGTKNEVAHHHVEAALEDIKSDRYRAPAHMEAEAVLLSLEKPALFTYKKCKRCKEMFGTNYRSVAYCSDHCRAVSFQTLTGLKWNSTRASQEERWGGEPPLVIPPSVLKLLLPWAQHLVEVSQNQNKMSDEQPQPQQQDQTGTPAFSFEFDIA